MDDIEQTLFSAGNAIADLLPEVEAQVERIGAVDPSLADGLRDLVHAAQGCADGFLSIASQWHGVEP